LRQRFRNTNYSVIGHCDVAWTLEGAIESQASIDWTINPEAAEKDACFFMTSMPTKRIIAISSTFVWNSQGIRNT
jgi:hypothetical protein